MKKDCLMVMKRWATWVILNYVNDHRNTQYKDLLQFSTPYSLNKIVKELLNWGLIKCFYGVVTGDSRVELTEKGRSALDMLRGFIEILRDKSQITGHSTDEEGRT